MKNYLFIFLITVLSKPSMASLGTLHCTFTEPFFNLQLNTDNKTLTLIEPNWDQVGSSSSVSRLLAKDLIINVEPYEANQILLTVQQRGKSKILMEAYLDYKGSDGMSELKYPYNVVFKDNGIYQEDGWIHYGGCYTNSLAAYNPMELSVLEYLFALDSEKAISLCNARALGRWTSLPSKSNKDQSVFYTLYSQEEVPGEPGNVSSTFSSWENEKLIEILKNSRKPAIQGTALKKNTEAKIQYCNTYGNFLQNRFAVKK